MKWNKQGFTENETVNLFAHSYMAEFSETKLDAEWSETAYQEFKSQHRESKLSWSEFHDQLAAALAARKKSLI